MITQVKKSVKQPRQVVHLSPRCPCTCSSPTSKPLSSKLLLGILPQLIRQLLVPRTRTTAIQHSNGIIQPTIHHLLLLPRRRPKLILRSRSNSASEPTKEIDTHRHHPIGLDCRVPQICRDDAGMNGHGCDAGIVLGEPLREEDVCEFGIGVADPGTAGIELGFVEEDVG